MARSAKTKAAPRARGRSVKPGRGPGPVESLRLGVSLLHMAFSFIAPLVTKFGDSRAFYSALGLTVDFVLYKVNRFYRYTAKRVVQACLLLYLVDSSLDGLLDMLRVGESPPTSPPPFMSHPAMLYAIVAGCVCLGVWLLTDAYVPRSFNEEVWDPFAEESGLESEAEGHMIAWFRVLVSATLVPVIEELEFRAFIPSMLWGGQWTSILLYTFTNENWAGALVSGLVYTGLHAVYGLWPAVLAHAVTNALEGVYAVGMKKWHVWQ